jgi:hypothetical protein
MDEMVMARNMGISDFSKLTCIPTATLRDWNKRGIASDIGQPGPNTHWLYSKSDAVKVKLAEILRNSGWDWPAALFAGSAIGSHFEGRAMHADEYYQNQYFAFVGTHRGKLMAWGSGPTSDDAIARARVEAGRGNTMIFTPSAFIVDLEAFTLILPVWMTDMMGIE